jgi:hypothetical protein
LVVLLRYFPRPSAPHRQRLPEAQSPMDMHPVYACPPAPRSNTNDKKKKKKRNPHCPSHWVLLSCVQATPRSYRQTVSLAIGYISPPNQNKLRKHAAESHSPMSPSLTMFRAQKTHTLLQPTGLSLPWLAPQYSRLLVKSPRSTPSRNRARTVETRFLSRGLSANWNGMGLAMSRIE